MCKCSIYLEVNKYRDYYDTIQQAVEEEISKEDKELANRIIKENQLVSLRFYPNTPISFYRVYGTSFDEVEGSIGLSIEEALKEIR